MFGYDDVLGAISPETAINEVRAGFIKHANGEWTMPPKVYLQSPPYGDFRAMPAAGDGIALLKWVTSFPGNPERGRPVVTGTILVSDATTGESLALIDGRSVTALRTGAAAAVATETLAPEFATTVGVVGCGLHGRWAAVCLAAAGFTEGVCADVNQDAATALAQELGWRSGTIEDALTCDVVTLVTPGAEPVLLHRHLHPGMHINALGADGSGKAEMTPEAVAECRVFCDEWEQASHGGELTGAVTAGLLRRERVTELGTVLTGDAPGRLSPDDMTLFDSTGLAIQDLALARAVLEAHRAGRIPARTVSF